MTDRREMPTEDIPRWFGTARASDARHVADPAAIVCSAAPLMR
ncbi:hypothetical protein [Sphingomonas sp. Leaf257]|nr:hypothetical protein [Sphingomonas sp. Leaf257]